MVSADVTGDRAWKAPVRGAVAGWVDGVGEGAATSVDWRDGPAAASEVIGGIGGNAALNRISSTRRMGDFSWRIFSLIVNWRPSDEPGLRSSSSSKEGRVVRIFQPSSEVRGRLGSFFAFATIIFTGCKPAPRWEMEKGRARSSMRGALEAAAGTTEGRRT